MLKTKVVLYVIICVCMFGTQAFAIDNTVNVELDIKSDLENIYGVNIVIPEGNNDFLDCIQVLEKSFKRFPDNIIKEITDYYLQNGIVTNVIIDTTENIEDLFSGYKINDSANIYINVLESSLHTESCHATEEAVIHEMGHFVSCYLFEVNDLEELKNEFKKLNKGYKYGNWSDDYSNAFINKHSANSFQDEVADLIWYAEVYPSILRNIEGGTNSIIHKKLKLLSEVLEGNFNSISENTQLWCDAFPQKPHDWAKDTIDEMKKASLIPEELDGIYESYIIREDFYKIILNILHKKIGEENLKKYFDIVEFEERVSLDPINGKTFIDDGMNNTPSNNMLSDNKGISYQTYPMEILNSEFYKNSKGYMSRLEISKALVYIGNKLGMDITEFDAISYNDINEVEEIEKPYIYVVANKGLLQGDGLNFKPHDYCTYQEAYLILMRFYNII